MASINFDIERQSFIEYYEINKDFFHLATGSFQTLVGLLLADNDSFETPTVLSRVKKRDECINKFQRKYQASLESTRTPYEIGSHITDLLGVRVICMYSSDIPLIQSVLAENFDVLGVTDKTQELETSDDTFGYKGLHMDLQLKAPRNGLPEYSRFADMQFEAQIRTEVQNAWSVLDHKIKYKKSIPHHLKRRINVLAALFELADQEFLTIREETKKLEVESRGGAGDIPTDQSRSLDAFRFMALVRDIFPSYNFIPYKADEFVHDLLAVDKDISAEILKKAFDQQWDVVSAYRDYNLKLHAHKLNPYTSIRHALYLWNRDKYTQLLFDFQRQNLEDWLRDRTPAMDSTLTPD